MEEIWKDIIGFEGLYQVSDHGRVRSLRDNHGQARIRVLKPKVDRYGYLRVNLYKDGKMKDYTVHRLVAEAFIPNPYNLPQVNHIDEDKQSNVVTNLEYCNAAYNNAYGTRIQQIVEKLSKRVYQYAKSGEFVRSYASTHEAERRTGYHNGYISACCNGKYKTAYDYIWSFNPPTPDTRRVLW